MVVLARMGNVDMHVLIIPSEFFLTQWSPLGGIFQLDLARALERNGVQAGVLSVGKFPGFRLFRGAQYAKREIIEGIPVLRRYIECPFPYRWDTFMRRLYSWLASNLYERYVDEFGKPDVIHAHNLRYAGCVAEILSRRAGVPFVVTEHSSEYSTGGIQGRMADGLAKVASRASGFSAVSNAFAATVCDALRLSRESVSVIPNLLSQEFGSGFARSTSPAHGAEFVFLNVAELVPVKNQRLLLEAFASRFRGRSARLRMVGGGPCRQDLVAFADYLGIADQVELLGRLSRTGVRKQMREADCFVLSSDSETFGVVLIEALSQGLPVVSTSCGGPSEIVNHRNGLLVMPKSAQGLAVAMQMMHDHRDRFDSLTISRECLERYGEACVIRGFMELYADAVYGRPSQRIRSRPAI